MKKVELLAPAGNYKALTGAVAAGADAIYLGGELYGARAYADNFTQEEICEGIRYAHLFCKRIYLTVNTLLKEKEMDGLYEYLLPFYEAGLDGVIIQDLGVLSFIKKYFPELELHISTQMSVTGSYGAGLLRQEGAVRIVPARELSLAEIKNIKKEADIEVEAFIHGAMCYCYSGQCLFSSMLGGRSGNRGRCAQPCRLPYRVDGGAECYPLSMKDMCTLEILPQLIEAGIDSFKIEGRMKKPEYAAGVTAIYHKYIDLYYENPAAFQVQQEDYVFLRSLYIRSEIGEGYFHTHNGKNMITIESPSYSGSREEVLQNIRNRFLEESPVLPVWAEAEFQKNQPAVMRLRNEKAAVCVTGETVEKAKNQPLSEEKIKKQILKSGNTNFKISGLTVMKDSDIFMPVSHLNALRRAAFSEMEKQLLTVNGFSSRTVPEKADFAEREEQSLKREEQAQKKRQEELHVLVHNDSQLTSAINCGADRYYIDGFFPKTEVLSALMKKKEKSGCEVYLAFPYILREKDKKQAEELLEFLSNIIFDGALVRNLESIAFLKEKGMKKQIAADCNLYVWNRESYDFLKKYVSSCCLALEENRHEWKELLRRIDGKIPVSVVAYGRFPMMISANCVKNTTKNCTKQQGFSVLTDRYSKDFPVYTDCNYCYNIIYNSVPLSLHRLFEKKLTGISGYRLDFTTENEADTAGVIQYFKEIMKKYREPDLREYTTGHYKRGAE